MNPVRELYDLNAQSSKKGASIGAVNLQIHFKPGKAAKELSHLLKYKQRNSYTTWTEGLYIDGKKLQICLAKHMLDDAWLRWVFEGEADKKWRVTFSKETPVKQEVVFKKEAEELDELIEIIQDSLRMHKKFLRKNGAEKRALNR